MRRNELSLSKNALESRFDGGYTSFCSKLRPKLQNPLCSSFKTQKETTTALFEKKGKRVNFILNWNFLLS